MGSDSVERIRCCCNCRHHIRTCDDGVHCISHCEIDGHYIGYVECFEGWCKRWAKERKWDARMLCDIPASPLLEKQNGDTRE